MLTLKNQPVFGESAFTLRHKRTSTYSFSRAVRFRSQKRADNVEYLNLPSTLDKRGTTQGYGQRWQPVGNLRKDSPAPGTYEIPTTFEMRSGPRFRKESPTRYHAHDDNSPGPGSYEIVQDIGKNAPKFTFRPRNILTKYIDTPCPGAYLPSISQTSAYKNISFGIGERSLNNTSSRFNSPGPGSYEAPSDFTKTGWKH
jgi:hypothetical protein